METCGVDVPPVVFVLEAVYDVVVVPEDVCLVLQLADVFAVSPLLLFGQELHALQLPFASDLILLLVDVLLALFGEVSGRSATLVLHLRENGLDRDNRLG